WSSVRKPWRFEEKWREAADTFPDSTAAYRFLASWSICFLAFFSLAATKLPNYVLPAAVPSALLIARFLDRWRMGEQALPSWIMPVGLAILAVIGIGTGVALAVLPGKLAFISNDPVATMPVL